MCQKSSLFLAGLNSVSTQLGIRAVVSYYAVELATKRAKKFLSPQKKESDKERKNGIYLGLHFNKGKLHFEIKQLYRMLSIDHWLKWSATDATSEQLQVGPLGISSECLYS